MLDYSSNPGLTPKPHFARKTSELCQDIHNLSDMLAARIVHLEGYNPKLSDKVKSGVRQKIAQIIDMLDELNRLYDHWVLEHPEI